MVVKRPRFTIVYRVTALTSGEMKEKNLQALNESINVLNAGLNVCHVFEGGEQKRSGYVQSYVVRWYVPMC